MTEVQYEPAAQARALGSDALRDRTRLAHLATEQALALPQSIADLRDYRRWLARFLGIYQPIEAILHSFREWTDWGIGIEKLGHSTGLRHDLAALHAEADILAFALDSALPMLPTFAAAFGALYVLEGSKLGGRFILRDLQSRIGPDIEGATTFFAGHGQYAGTQWNAFKTALEAFLLQRPDEFPRVVAGADSTFAAILAWMSPLREAGVA